jgi:hypothetical protein
MATVADYPMDYREPWIDERGLIRAQTGSERRTKEAVEHSLDVAEALTADGKRQGIIDARALTHADPDAWLAFVYRIDSIVTALAVLVSDMTTPTMTVLLERFNNRLFLAAQFRDEESAVAWLESLQTDPDA